MGLAEYVGLAILSRRRREFVPETSRRYLGENVAYEFGAIYQRHLLAVEYGFRGVNAEQGCDHIDAIPNDVLGLVRVVRIGDVGEIMRPYEVYERGAVHRTSVFCTLYLDRDIPGLCELETHVPPFRRGNGKRRVPWK